MDDACEPQRLLAVPFRERQKEEGGLVASPRAVRGAGRALREDDFY